MNVLTAAPATAPRRAASAASADGSGFAQLLAGAATTAAPAGPQEPVDVPATDPAPAEDGSGRPGGLEAAVAVVPPPLHLPVAPPVAPVAQAPAGRAADEQAAPADSPAAALVLTPTTPPTTTMTAAASTPAAAPGAAAPVTGLPVTAAPAAVAPAAPAAVAPALGSADLRRVLGLALSHMTHSGPEQHAAAGAPAAPGEVTSPINAPTATPTGSTPPTAPPVSAPTELATSAAPATTTDQAAAAADTVNTVPTTALATPVTGPQPTGPAAVDAALLLVGADTDVTVSGAGPVEVTGADVPQAAPTAAVPVVTGAAAGAEAGVTGPQAPDARTAAPAAPAAPTPAPPPAAQVVQVLAPVLAGPDGSYSMSLQLYPEELGAVQVEVLLRGGEIRLALHAPDETALAALRAALPDLKAELQAGGLTATSLSVDDGKQGQQDRSTDGSPERRQDGQGDAPGRRQDPYRGADAASRPSPSHADAALDLRM